MTVDVAIPLSAAEVARRCGVTTVTVYRWVRAGRLQARKMPGLTGAYLFSQSDVDALAAERAR